MGRIALFIMLIASPALAQSPQPAPVQPPAAAPLSQRSTCRSNLYLEPTLLAGATRKSGIARLHAAAGFRYSHCPANEPEGFRLHLGLFVQVGSEEIGDAFTKGIETEFNLPFREARLGGRAYYGTANHELFIVGAGVRYRTGQVHFGFEMIYSSRSTEGQPAAVAGVAAFGVSGKAGAIVAGVIGVLALVALSQFNTT
jgi:hypothetical protein